MEDSLAWEMSLKQLVMVILSFCTVAWAVILYNVMILRYKLCKVISRTFVLALSVFFSNLLVLFAALSHSVSIQVSQSTTSYQQQIWLFSGSHWQ